MLYQTVMIFHHQQKVCSIKPESIILPLLLVPNPVITTSITTVNCSNDTININVTNSTGSSNAEQSESENNVTCRYDFINENGYCWASCHKWKQDSETTTFVSKIVEIVSAFIGILSTIICLGFSIYEYKKM